MDYAGTVIDFMERLFVWALGIGVVVSMFSAITVTRTLMLLVVSWRPAARRLWLFMPVDQEEPAGGVPALAGGSGGSDDRQPR